VNNALGHQGLHLDTESALYYNRNRYFSPALGRFITRDPLGYVDGMSTYEYLRSRPQGRRDPIGTISTFQYVYKSLRWRQLGIRGGTHYGSAHPTAHGFTPLIAGVMWGLGQAVNDYRVESKQPTVGQAAWGSGLIVAEGTGAAITLTTLGKTLRAPKLTGLGGVVGRTSLYAAAFYAGFSIGEMWNGYIENIENEARWYNQKRRYFSQMGQGAALRAIESLKSAPEVCCNGKWLQLGPNVISECSQRLVSAFQAQTEQLARIRWDAYIGDTYEAYEHRLSVDAIRWHKLDVDIPNMHGHKYVWIAEQYIECIQRHCY
jgi:RHS repeat-associated protein